MIEPDPIGADARRAARRRKLPADAACVYCGERNPKMLVTASRSLLDRHHLGGKANDPGLIAVLCLNHHALNTAAQLDAGVEFGDDLTRTMPERLVSVLDGMAVFFALLAEHCALWAQRLADLIVAWDGLNPAWRELPQALM